MHRFRSWTLDPPEWRTQRNRSLPVEGGDGSTLSLDFTAGVLDSRITFDRTSNATFVNSLGYIQYADSNMLLDTTIQSSPTFPWNPFTSTGGTNSVSSGSVTSSSGTSGRAFYRTSISVSAGLQYSVAMEITELSGGERLDLALVASNATEVSYWMNGEESAGSSSVTTGILTLIFTATSSTTEIRFGVGANASSSNKVIVWTKPRMIAGVSSLPVYIENTSVSAGKYNIPRFEYDPVTKNPKGVLIEPQRANTITGYSSGTGLTITSKATTSPMNLLDGLKAEKTDTTTPRFFRWATTITPITNTEYTASMFVKRGDVDMVTSLEYNVTGNWGGTAWRVDFDVTEDGVEVLSESNATGFVQNMGNGWYRVSAAFTTGGTTPTANGLILSRVSGTTGNYIYLWGGQLEEGTGASSYIPTGSSTVTRNQDSMLISDITSLGFNRIVGTFLIRGEQNTYGKSYSRTLQFWDAAEAMGMAVNGTTFFGTSRANLSTVISERSRVNTLYTPYAFGFSLDSEDAAVCMRVSLNGSSSSAARSNPGPTASAALLRFNLNSTPAAYASMNIRSVKFWPTAKTLAQLDELTIGA